MVTKIKCKLCGHRWLARVEDPRSCPNCKRYDWNKQKEVKEDEYKE